MTMVLWLKAFHIIAMVCWFAGLFYLPRLFVYHANLELNDSSAYDRFCVMERRLFWGIMTPSAVLTLFFGIGLMHSFRYPFNNLPQWLSWKLACVAILILYHFYCGVLVKKFNSKKNPHRALFYRWFNEFPVLILIAAVILAVVKPVF